MGARWVQGQLNKYQSDTVKVYVVWLPMLDGDARDKWQGRFMPDPRVIHFWAGEYMAGQWFAGEVDGYQGIAWDVYYLYGPDATWETVPSPLAGTGRTIYHERETLKKQLLTLLKE
jgi:hypothetical protein